jgi:hypothetical protein
MDPLFPALVRSTIDAQDTELRHNTSAPDASEWEDLDVNMKSPMLEGQTKNEHTLQRARQRGAGARDPFHVDQAT